MSPCAREHSEIVHSEGDCPLCRALRRVRELEQSVWELRSAAVKAEADLAAERSQPKRLTRPQMARELGVSLRSVWHYQHLGLLPEGDLVERDLFLAAIPRVKAHRRPARCARPMTKEAA